MLSPKTRTSTTLANCSASSSPRSVIVPLLTLLAGVSICNVTPPQSTFSQSFWTVPVQARTTSFFDGRVDRRWVSTGLTAVAGVTGVLWDDGSSSLVDEDSGLILEDFCPPAPLLVGIEPNPGPGKKQVQKAAKKKVTMNSAAKSLTSARGRGDYNIGGRIGGWIGDKAQKLIETIFGGGDYTVKSNSITAPNNSVPQFTEGKGFVRIRHREYIGDLNSSQSFFARDIPIDPTVTSSFPWLSGIVNNYQKYKFLGVVLEYKTMSGMVANSGATGAGQGTVILSTRYDPDAPIFVSKIQMEEYEFTQSTVPWESCIHPIECDPSEDTLDFYLLANPGTQTAAGGSTRFTRKCVSTVATVGFPNTTASVVGEMWLSYDIILRDPRLPQQSLSAHWRGINGSDQTNPIPVIPGTAGQNFLTGVQGSSSTILLTPGPASSGSNTNILNWPAGYPGTWLLIARADASTALGALSFSFGNGITASTNVPQLWIVDNQNFFQMAPAGNQQAMATYCFTAGITGGQMSVNLSSTVAAFTSLDIVIVPINSVPPVSAI